MSIECLTLVVKQLLPLVSYRLTLNASMLKTFNNCCSWNWWKSVHKNSVLWKCMSYTCVFHVLSGDYWSNSEKNCYWLRINVPPTASQTEYLTLTSDLVLSPMRDIDMTDTHAKGQGQKSLGFSRASFKLFELGVITQGVYFCVCGTPGCRFLMFSCSAALHLYIWNRLLEM